MGISDIQVIPFCNQSDSLRQIQFIDAGGWLVGYAVPTFTVYREFPVGDLESNDLQILIDEHSNPIPSADFTRARNVMVESKSTLLSNILDNGNLLIGYKEELENGYVAYLFRDEGTTEIENTFTLLIVTSRETLKTVDNADIHFAKDINNIQVNSLDNVNHLISSLPAAKWRTGSGLVSVYEEKGFD